MCLISGITCHIWLPETKNVTTPEVITPEDEQGNKALSTLSEKRLPDRVEFNLHAYENPVTVT